MELIVGVVAGIAILWLALLGVLWLLRPRDVAARELLRLVPDLVRMLRALLADPATPVDVRVALIVLVAWIVFPIDLIPEFVPVLGPLDDLVVTLLVLRYVGRRVGWATLRERWPGTDDGFALVVRVVGAQE